MAWYLRANQDFLAIEKWDMQSLEPNWSLVNSKKIIMSIFTKQSIAIYPRNYGTQKNYSKKKKTAWEILVYPLPLFFKEYKGN